jgi:hypothetical protein
MAAGASAAANATRDAARSALTAAQARLARVEDFLATAQEKRAAAASVGVGAPAQLGAAQFRVRAL